MAVPRRLRASSSPPRGALAVEAANGGTALLIVDMISCWDFPDADKLLPAAVAVTSPIAALKRRCKAKDVPVIYANDNRGRWRSDFSALVDLSMAGGGPGAAVTAGLAPDHDDYFVLKPQQSAFVATPLEQLLSVLKVHRLIVTGVVSDQCVMSTASDARMRGFEVVLPKDCTATQTARRQAPGDAARAVRHGLRHLDHVRLAHPSTRHTGAANPE